MPTRRFIPTALFLGSALALACSQDSSTPLQSNPSTGADQVVTAPLASVTISPLPPFDPDNFVRRVDNPLFPLPLGRRLVYKGSEDGEFERVITDVTRDQKTILGVPVVVVLDRVFKAGQLAERTFDWYAQDKQGNVWYFGENTREFENGKVVSTAGSFEAGRHGAKAGIIMRARPVLHQITPQEDAPGVAEDMGRPLDLDATITTPYGTLHHCMKQAEFTPLEPGALEYKFYCPGIGVARGRDVRGGTANTALTAVIQR